MRFKALVTVLNMHYLDLLKIIWILATKTIPLQKIKR